MRRLRYLTALGVWALVACGDSPQGGAGAAGSTSEPAASGDAAGGRPGSAPVREGTTAIEIAAVIGGRELGASGLGECQHTAEGSIYERPASLWTVQYDGGDAEAVRHLILAFWRERSGTESFNLALGTGSEVHRIATVQGGELRGGGTAKLEGGAKAGTFVVEGTTAEGTPVRLRVRCERFTALVAEGG